ncbi:isocitrate lyase/phosphoenolpyruvate mutase family protein [Cytophagaceae bacterium DM2B3-1]|uniref:Isocitrate lyase/phosphoenolpyruvate mutase family protein n=1 Tax=Xanthocytophaga flava TaxID=3048013 RepID=A0ABT7CF19_9BACT|nr:isocitrate lyase/phosphoenolpyruvate mutase family protein [Xanthocytophaga flavus]MDJ1492111.1 isocitrate lyase/phosphoenolpyruvate mutase family protein [Xanthocytophaga flavus]
MNSFDTFSQLHQNSTPLLLGNIWDVHSALLFEANGYKAIGTSSQAIAKTFGYEDGENIPFETLFLIAKRVTEVVKIPFSVDLEGGYSRTIDGIIENITKLHAIGVAGINLEDSIPRTTRQLQSIHEFQKTLSTIANHLNRNNMKVFLNIRTDGFLLGMETALKETLSRLKSYEEAGANGIFVPCITQSNDISEVVKATALPVNVMCMPTLPSFEDLQKLGVKRISMGPFTTMYVHKRAEEAIHSIQQNNSFSILF